MKRILCITLFIAVTACSSVVKKSEKKTILISCASSLTNVMQEIVAEYNKNCEIQIHLNAASSGTLARQIENGAEASVFISASKNWIDYLSGKKLTVVSTESRLAGNSMVIVVPLDSQIDTIPLNELSHFPGLFKGRLSIGDPAYVPAGVYAKQAMQKMGFFDELEKRLLPAKDVRSALMVVEMGEVEAGIVFKTDALKSEKVKLVANIPEEYYDPVEYYSVVIMNHQSQETMAFYEFLYSEKAKQILFHNK